MDDICGAAEMRVLVVEDDDRKIAAFVVKGLREAGFAVDRADNGEDGLHMALSVAYDAAVIDLMLPRLDGLSLIERLREALRRRPDRSSDRRRRLPEEAVFLY